MIRLKDAYVVLGVAALALLPAVSALGQDPPPRQTTAGSGQSSGVAVPRGGGSSAPAPSSPSPTSGGASTDAGSWGGGRTNDDGAGSRRAVGGGSYTGAPTNEQAGARRSGGSDAVTAAPWYARPRGNEPATGVAIGRDPSRPPVPPGSGGGYSPYQGYYPGSGYYPGYPGYGYGNGYNPWYGWGAFGLGYFYYDPFTWGYGAPYGGSAGYYGYGSSPYGYGGSPYGYGGGSSGFGRTGYGSQHVEGGLRLKVKPNTANIFVDGYFAGRVDDFDGMFQKLAIAEGTHKIEITLQGYRPLVFEVNIQAFETITYTGALEPLVR